MTITDAHIGIDPWHELTDDEKEAEFEKERASEFYAHPDFSPVYCMDCGQHVWPTYGGRCPESSEHYVGPYPDEWSDV